MNEAARHLDDDVCATLVLGLASPAEHEAAITHARTCVACEARLRAHAGAGVRARADHATGAGPLRVVTSRPARMRRVLVAGVSAAAAAVLAVFFFVRDPGVRTGAAPAWLTTPGEVVRTRSGVPVDDALRDGLAAYARHDLPTAIAALRRARVTGGAEQARTSLPRTCAARVGRGPGGAHLARERRSRCAARSVARGSAALARRCLASDRAHPPGRFDRKRSRAVIGRPARAIALAFAIANAGCRGNAPVAEMPGATWSRVLDTIDSLGARDQIEDALQVVATARAHPRLPAWLAADLAANAASLQRRAALPAPARAAARAVDASALRVPDLLDHDSLTVAHRLAREVVDARARTDRPGDPMLGRARMQLAEAAFHMSRGGEADSLAREVLAHLTLGPDSLHPLAADAEQMVGRVIKNFSGARYRDDAMMHYQRALRIRERTDGPHSLAVAGIHHDLGNLERQARRPDDAIAHFRHALEIRRAILGPHDEEVASTLSAIAWLSASRGDWPGVERDMREALVAVPESALTAPSVLALRTGLLGQALRRMGRTEEAIVSLRTAVAAAETMWARVPHDGEGSVQAGLSIHRELALALAAEGHAEEAFEQVERSQLRLWVPDAPAGGWSRVLPRVQRALPGDAALVLWPRTALFPPGGDYPMWVCVVRHSGRPAWVRVERTSGWPLRGTPPREALNRELVHAAQWPLRVSDTRAIDSLAATMGTELVTPIDPLLRGVSRLIVSGPDLMAWTPLSMLRDANGIRLMDRFVITYVPSALAYADLAERPADVPAANPERALLVGAPEPGRDEATRWPPLTGAADELSGLSRLFPEATVLTGSDATAARLNAMARSGALDRYGVVHLAAHIDLNPARVLQSAFVLAPDRPGDPRGSRLTAARIAGQWHVHAGLVSLAGCHSALGLYSASEGWLGMHSAFLAAGAPCLLVSMWQVDDEATRRLMIEFHTRLLAQTGTRDPAQALRAAQRAVREYRAGDGTRPFAHPVYWAGFAVVGRG